MKRPDRQAVPLPAALKLLGLKPEDAKDVLAATARNFRELAKATHPDKGGDAALFAELVRAREAVQREPRLAARLLAAPETVTLTNDNAGVAWVRYTRVDFGVRNPFYRDRDSENAF